MNVAATIGQRADVPVAIRLAVVTEPLAAALASWTVVVAVSDREDVDVATLVALHKCCNAGLSISSVGIGLGGRRG